MNSTGTIQTDIAIIGAGVGGCIAALTLSRKFNVLLMDKLSAPLERIGECLPPASRRILGSLNLLRHFETETGEPAGPHLKSMGMQSYWGSERVHITDHLRNPDGSGWHLDRRVFEAFLREEVKKAGVACLMPARLTSSSHDGHQWRLIAETIPQDATRFNQSIKARFVIDAAGRQSPFAKQQGLQRQQFDKLIGCWATMRDAVPMNLGVIASAKNGWWYTASLPNNRRVMAFHTDSDLLPSGMHKDPDQFLQEAGAIQPMKPFLEVDRQNLLLQGIVSANSTSLPEASGLHWAALGDAAVSLDPLSSQGMFNAMATAMQLSHLLKDLDFSTKPDPLKCQQIRTVYNEQVLNIWNAYMRHKMFFYNQEGRWPESEFWKRRRFKV